MTETLNIGILEAGPPVGALGVRHGGSSDAFIRILSAEQYDFSFTVYDAFAGVLPETIDACDAYLITGSPSNAYETLPWITSAADFLRTAAGQKPVVGVCFGHQLLHHAHGGRAEKSDHGWGVGVHQYTIERSHDWMGATPDSFRLLVSHQDQVTKLAKGAVRVAGSPFCPNAVATIGDNILTIQGHPDYTEAFARDLYEMRRDKIGEVQLDEALDSLNQVPDSEMVTDWIAQFILSRTE